ncbi:glutaredoxin-C8-like [Actinia tenebrosa]|uniref:Glutaredoxin-2, mitochondrial n=1 Tax=Actinia tenebrosa TaxID=6105 RepID=A0A6P8JDC6_ACTTE|nr:glutaredoxin-C8-like [Actinia tenebrosa]
MAVQKSLKFIEQAVRKDAVVVFSKTTCSFSLMAKRILKEAGVSKMTVFELERRKDGESIQDALQEMTGKRTVPNVFIKGKSIGGGTETAELYQSGRLKELLEEHGLLKK